MAKHFLVYPNTNDWSGGASSTTYSVARENSSGAGSATQGSTNTTNTLGQSLVSGSYKVEQAFFQFDTSVASGSITKALVAVKTGAASTAGLMFEFREASWVSGNLASSFVAGSALSTKPLFGSFTTSTTSGTVYTANTSLTLTPSSSYQLNLSAQKQRTNTAPTVNEQITLNMGNAAAANRPYMLLESNEVGISLVGARSFSHNSTSIQSCPLTDLLDSFGNTATLEPNDVVFVNCVHSMASTNTMTLSGLTPSGYSNTHTSVVTANDSNAVAMALTYKAMGSTPDTSIAIPPCLSTSNSMAVSVQVWRGINASGITTVTPTTASGGNTALANPPTITTPSEAGCVVLGAFGAAQAVATPFTNAGGTPYDSFPLYFISGTSGGGTNKAASGLGAKTGLSPSTAFDAAITGSTTTNTGSWSAVSVILRPADNVAPTITSSDTTSVDENSPLVFALTADEPVTWSILTTGQDVSSVDYAHFEIAGSALRWSGNGTKDHEAPTDFDANNTYIVVVRATDGSGNFADKTITVTVNDLVVEYVRRKPRSCSTF